VPAVVKTEVAVAVPAVLEKVKTVLIVTQLHL
jgi:hypothetical protein